MVRWRCVAACHVRRTWRPCGATFPPPTRPTTVPRQCCAGARAASRVSQRRPEAPRPGRPSAAFFADRVAAAACTRWCCPATPRAASHPSAWLPERPSCLPHTRRRAASRRRRSAPSTPPHPPSPSRTVTVAVRRSAVRTRSRRRPNYSAESEKKTVWPKKNGHERESIRSNMQFSKII